MIEQQKVLKLIEAVQALDGEARKRFTQGECYAFHEWLKTVIPSAVAYYDNDHVISKIGTRFYDITGEVAQGNALPMSAYGANHVRNLKAASKENRAKNAQRWTKKLKAVC